MITLLNANALHIPLADKSVQCVVTSPPYWGLRDYGTATWEGGNPECDHKKGEVKWRSRDKSTIGFAESQGHNLESWGDRCGKCGAIRKDAQLGLERTPEEYTANMVQVFREVWRVLRDDGVLWLNLGDSYANTKVGNTNEAPDKRPRPYFENGTHLMKFKKELPNGLKPKDLVGIPWRVAFALQADGWYLRSDIIWSKPNPMPESVTDRPTKAHEYVFLMSKSQRYFYDAEAVKEEAMQAGKVQSPGSRPNGDNPDRNDNDFAERNKGKVFNNRNRRTVWTIATEPYKGAHFATYPTALVEPCIKAGTSEKGAGPKCGKPWERVVEKTGGTIGKSWHNHEDDLQRGMRGGDNGRNIAAELYKTYKVETTGWQPACKCDAGDPIPCLVLDPFAGSGTTLLVARELGRSAVGLDLSMSYLREQAYKRLDMHDFFRGQA